MIPPFSLDGPDGEGFVWLHTDRVDKQIDLNLGKVETVVETLSQWLADNDEREQGR